MTPWLSIVGIGEDGLDGVAPPGRLLIDQAETLVGGARHLAMAPETHPAERLQWSSPLDKIIAEILARRGRRVCVLATGNPLWYGIATTLAGVVDAAEMTIVPAPSAFSWPARGSPGRSMRPPASPCTGGPSIFSASISRRGRGWSC